MGKHDIVSPEPAERHYEVGPHVPSVSFGERLEVIVHYRRFVAGVTLAVTALGALYAFAKPSTYEANLLIQVEDMRSVEPRSLLGQSTGGAGFRMATSELELLRSRAIVGTAVDKLRLDLSATPRYFPLVGRAIARWNAWREAPAWAALGAYAWGTEAIRAGVLEVPPSMEDRPFTITKSGHGEYRVENAQAGVATVGKTGQLHRIAASGGQILLRVDELVGPRGATYTLVKRNKTSVVEDIAAALKVDELGRDTGMIRVGLQDADPRRAKAILDQIGVAYMDFVRTQKGLAARESLAVLRAQLPAMEKRVADAEARYERYRRRERATDLDEDVKLQLARYSATQMRLTDLYQKKAELGASLGDAHPAVVALDRQIARVRGDGSQAEAGMRRLPAVATDIERLARDLKADTEMYGSVLRRIEELSMEVQDQSSNVRLVDEAVAPVRPIDSPLPTVLFAGVLGFALGTAGAVVRRFRAGKHRETLLDAEEQTDEHPLQYAHAR